MKWYIIKRLLQIIPVILGVTIIAFLLIHLAPGDPARTMLGQHATETEINEIREKYGDRFSLVDRPRKHRYIFFNCKPKRKKELLGKLKYKIESYPKPLLV